MSDNPSVPRALWEYSTRLDTDVEYTPDDLRRIASDMERDGKLAIRLDFEADYGDYSLTFFEQRLETPDEVAARLKNEEREQERQRKRQRNRQQDRRKALIAEARAMGLKVEDPEA